MLFITLVSVGWLPDSVSFVWLVPNRKDPLILKQGRGMQFGEALHRDDVLVRAACVFQLRMIKEDNRV